MYRIANIWFGLPCHVYLKYGRMNMTLWIFLMDILFSGSQSSTVSSFFSCGHIHGSRPFSSTKLAGVVVECFFTTRAGNKCLHKIDDMCSKATSGWGHHYEFSVLDPSLNECHYCALQQSNQRQECESFWLNVPIHSWLDSHDIPLTFIMCIHVTMAAFRLSDNEGNVIVL